MMKRLTPSSQSQGAEAAVRCGPMQVGDMDVVRPAIPKRHQRQP